MQITNSKFAKLINSQESFTEGCWNIEIKTEKDNLFSEIRILGEAIRIEAI